MLLGVGIDYAIQMHSRVEEEVILDRAEHPIQETARGLGYDIPDEEEAADEEEAPSKKKKRRKPAEPDLPILAVYFSTFIIQ